jgi:aminomethyltransferase
MIGLVLDEKGVLRHGQRVLTAAMARARSCPGTFSPTLGKAIALRARAGRGAGRGAGRHPRREVPVRVVKLPFVRDGRPAGVEGLNQACPRPQSALAPDTSGTIRALP